MPLSPGTSLGPYEVLAPLGAGGMGEVFRGRDSRLGRDVAIKILPAELSSNSDRLRRFEQEARSASALNHPNIITIYDIGSVDSRSYIAMELVDGKTLRELLQSGPLPSRKALQIATQFAEGLNKAHEAGIVHRDLKPENIMITKDGYVKILDFGLAKLFQPATDQVSALPTSAQTDAGIVMGTVGYMSPEQASGSEIDFRSDQFSFGAIFYEMVIGKRAFQKKTAVETMAAIIQEDPDFTTSPNMHIPAPVKWIIERCLEKNPADRYASSKDLARELQSIRDHYSEIVSTSEAIAPVTIAKRPNLHKVFDAIGIALILVLLSGLIYLATRHSKPVETSAIGYHRLTYSRGPIRSARFTPDGQTIVYGASFLGPTRELYQTRPDRGESRMLGIQNAEILSISKTGEMLILIPNQKRILSQVPITGGSPRALAEGIFGAEWSPDGSAIALSRRINEKMLLEFPVGKVLYQSAMMIDRIRISGSGNFIAFVEHVPGGSNGSVVIIDKQGKTITRSQELYPLGISWNRQDKEVWFTTISDEPGGGHELIAIDLNGSSRLLQRFPGGTNLYDISSDGKMLIAFTDDRTILMFHSSKEKEERDLSWLDQPEVVDFTSDGKKMLLWERGEGSESPSGTIYIRGVDGSPAMRLAGGAPKGFLPDEKSVVANVGGKKIVVVPTGAGNTRTIEHPEYSDFNPLGILPDGKTIFALAGKKNKEVVYALQNINGGKPKLLDLKGLFPNRDYKIISPNGKFVLMQNSEEQNFVCSLDSQTMRPIPKLEPQEVPFQWTKDGDVLVMNPFVVPTKVFKVNVTTGSRQNFAEIHPGDLTGVVRIDSLLFTPDETSYAYSYHRILSTLYLVQNLH